MIKLNGKLKKSVSVYACAAMGAIMLTACSSYSNDNMSTHSSDMKMAKTMKPLSKTSNMPNWPIYQNIAHSSNHTTLAAAVNQAQVVSMLDVDGPFTLFAPTDDAFGMVPSASVNMLMMEENRAVLQKVLATHVVPGAVMSGDLTSMISDAGGKLEVKNAAGGNLWFWLDDGKVKMKSEGGSWAYVTTVDLKSKNGVIHIIDHVLLPKM